MSTEDTPRTEPDGDFNSQWAQLVARAWNDDDLKQRLLDDPKTVMQEHGLPVPSGINVKVVQNSDDTIYLPLAQKPALSDLSEEDFSQAALANRPIGGYCGKDTCSVTYFPLRAETTE